MSQTLPYLATAAALFTPTGAAQAVWVPDRTNDVVVQLNALDGSLENAAAIDLVALTGGLVQDPLEIESLGSGELALTDDGAHQLFAFQSLGGVFTGTSNAVFGQVGGVANSAAGFVVANAGGPGDALMDIDAAGSFLGAVPISDPKDVEPLTLGGLAGYLVADDANDTIWFVDASDLTLQVPFHVGTGAGQNHDPQQIHASPWSGRIYVARGAAPGGIYEYDSGGNQIGFVDTLALAGVNAVRGVYEVPDGLLFSHANGVSLYDEIAGTVQPIVSGIDAGYFSLVEEPPFCACDVTCLSNPNSTGMNASLTGLGSSVLASNALVLECTNLPFNATGFFITSNVTGMVANPGGSLGILCLGGGIGRFLGPGQILNAGSTGVFALAPDLAAHPTPTGFVSVAVGETWFYQAWYRDNVGGTPASNFSDNLAVTFM